MRFLFFFIRHSLFLLFFFFFIIQEKRRDIEVSKVSLNFATGRTIGGMLVLWNILSRGYLGKVIVEEDIFKIFFKGGILRFFFLLFFGIHKYVKKDCVMKYIR